MQTPHEETNLICDCDDIVLVYRWTGFGFDICSMVVMMYDLRRKGFYGDIYDFLLELLFVWI